MMGAFCLLVSSVALAHACDTAEELAADLNVSFSHNGRGGRLELPRYGAPLTLLPQTEGDESPACLDGSPYGFYFNPSKTGSKRWTISIEGVCSAFPPRCAITAPCLTRAAYTAALPPCLFARGPSPPVGTRRRRLVLQRASMLLAVQNVVGIVDQLVNERRLRLHERQRRRYVRH